MIVCAGIVEKASYLGMTLLKFPSRGNTLALASAILALVTAEGYNKVNKHGRGHQPCMATTESSENRHVPLLHFIIALLLVKSKPSNLSSSGEPSYSSNLWRSLNDSPQTFASIWSRTFRKDPAQISPRRPMLISTQRRSGERNLTNWRRRMLL